MPETIFVVDSSPAVRRMVEQISAPEGFQVVGFQDGPAALVAARKLSPALIIADYHLDNMTFSGFCKEVYKLDNLSETYLISLIDAADRLDENHLRTLGVKAFLKKPFQAEDLLDIVKSLQQKQHQAAGAILKRRAWPPTSTATDAEGDEDFLDQAEPSEGFEEPEQQPEPAAVSAPSTPTAASSSPSAKSDRTEDALADLIHQSVERAIATRVRAIVHKELEDRLSEMLSQERLAELVKSLLAQELPRLIQQEIAARETAIHDTVSETVGTLIKERLNQLVQEQSESGVRKFLPDAVREHLGSIDLIVTDAVRQAAAKQAPLIADDVVRSSAELSVEQAVQRIVPELAEQHIKAELKRLTSAE